MEELRNRMQTLATSIILSALVKGYAYPDHNSECSKLAEELRKNLRHDLSMEVQKRQAKEYRQGSFGHSSRRPPAAWQPAIGALLEKLQGLAKACKECKKNVDAFKLDTFGLSLAGNNLRQVAMLPEWYWA